MNGKVQGVWTEGTSNVFILLKERVSIVPQPKEVLIAADQHMFGVTVKQGLNIGLPYP